MKFIDLFLTFTIVLSISECSGYRILAVFPFNSKSHNINFNALTKSLAKRGHQVDVISHFPLKKPLKNHNEIINLNGTMENHVNNYTIDFVLKLQADLTNMISIRFGNKVCKFLGLDSFQKLIKNPPMDPPYDLVITEAFAANCYFGLGYVFNVPVVAVSTAVEYPWISDFIGNDDNPAYVTNTFYDKFGKLGYWNRLINFLSNFMELRKFHVNTEKIQTEIMQKYLCPDIPNIREVEKNVALTLVVSSPIIFGIKPITPSMIQIAGLHIEENEENLTPELNKWMDDSKNGIIYFTLGSMVLIESMPEHTLKEMYEVFKKVAPIRVLLKVVNKSKLPPGLPENVKTLPWIPQIPVLAHPNIKLFITHGGLGSLMEALHFGVPTIGIPLFSDQFRNCKAFSHKKMMVTVDFKQFSGKLLDSAIETLFNDSIYTKNAKYYSKLFRDEPLTPIERAHFWIEYVIRNGAVLRSPALDYSWWQLAMLDVYALFLVILIIILFFAMYIIRLTLSKIFKFFSEKLIKEKKKLE